MLILAALETPPLEWLWLPMLVFSIPLAAIPAALELLLEAMPMAAPMHHELERRSRLLTMEAARLVVARHKSWMLPPANL